MWLRKAEPHNKPKESSTADVACRHSSIQHLLIDPLCKDQSLFKRIVNIAFHVLTLGIPFAIYKIIACCCPSFVESFEAYEVPPPFIYKRVESVESIPEEDIIKPLSDLEQAAIDRGNEILASTDKNELDGLESREVSFESSNPDIERLMKLSKIYNKRMFDLVQDRDSKTIWTDPEDTELLNCFDDLMSINYAVFNLGLEEFIVEYSIINKLEAIATQNGYMSTIFYDLVLPYHNVRGNLRYEGGDFLVYDLDTIEKNKALVEENKAFMQKSEPFYKEGRLSNINGGYCIMHFVIDGECMQVKNL